MATSSVHALLATVRRHLWRAEFMAALRLALWASAGLLLVAVAVHLVVSPVPARAAGLVLALPWAALFARAAARRPDDAACALWADRHLGGASAFTTLVELDRVTAGRAHAPARRSLEQWAASRVPACLQQLATLPATTRLPRPLLSTAVCAALAGFVLSLPGRLPDVLPAPAVAAAVAERPLSVADAAVPSALVNEVASALRAAERPGPPEPRGAGGAPTAGPAKAGDGPAPAAAPPAAVPGDLVAVHDVRPATPVDTLPTPRGGTTSGGGTGREAGDSADRRGDGGVSRGLQARQPVPRSELGPRPASAARQADTNQLGSYQDDASAAGATGRLASPAPAAATPPAVAESTRLSPTETTYVQTWLKASTRRP